MAISSDEFDETEENQEIISPEDAAFHDLESELRDLARGKIRVSRKTDGRGSPGGYAFTVGVDEMTLDELLQKIRNDCGGGTYRLRMTRANGTFAFNRDIPIIGDAKKEPTAVVPIQNNSDDKFVTMLLQMQENTRAMIDGMREQQLMQAQSANTMLLDFMKILQTKPETGNQPTSLTELMTILATSQKLFGENKSVSELEIFLKGIEFGKENNGDESALTTMVKSLGPSLASIVEETRAQKLQMVQRTPMKPPPPPQTSIAEKLAAKNNTEKTVTDRAGSIETEKTDKEDAIVIEANGVQIPQEYEEFAHILPIIMRGAEADGDPEVYANVLLDMVPQDKLLEIVGDKNRFVFLLDFLPPECRQYDEWLLFVRDIVVEIIQEEQADAEQTRTEQETDQIFNDTGNDHVSENERSDGEIVSDDEPPDSSA